RRPQRKQCIGGSDQCRQVADGRRVSCGIFEQFAHTALCGPAERSATIWPGHTSCTSNKRQKSGGVHGLAGRAKFLSRSIAVKLRRTAIAGGATKCGQKGDTAHLFNRTPCRTS